MELIGMILARAPGTTNIQKQRAISVKTPDVQRVPLVRSFILQHCNMEPATNLHVWSQTNAQAGPFVEGKLCTDFLEMEILEPSVRKQFFTSICILTNQRHASTMSQLKNNHSPEGSRRILKKHRQKHSQCSRNCTFGLLKLSNIKVNFWRMRTWDIGSTWHRPSSKPKK